MDKIDYTFGVLTFNQADLIYQTLNSIKYQIQNYGYGIRCQLIIVDDCSSDSTVNSIESWLMKNAHLFANIIKRYNIINKGVTINFNYVMNLIENENFKIIAGDDLISSNNIFKKNNTIEKNTIYNGLPVYILGNELVLQNNIIRHQFWVHNKDLNKKQIFRQFKEGRLLHTPSILYSKQMFLDAKCAEFNSQFKLFEDNPSWYCMFKNLPDLNTSFDNECLVLYRISEKSISNGKKKDVIHNEFETELIKLYKIYINEGDIFDKIFFSIKLNGFFDRIHILSFFENIKKYYIVVYCIFHYKKFKSFKEHAINDFQKQKIYFEKIKIENI